MKKSRAVGKYKEKKMEKITWIRILYPYAKNNVVYFFKRMLFNLYIKSE